MYIYVYEQLKINLDILQILRIIYLSKIDSNWAELSLVGSKELQDLNKMINRTRTFIPGKNLVVYEELFSFQEQQESIKQILYLVLIRQLLIYYYRSHFWES